jgi:hypothetical protein
MRNKKRISKILNLIEIIWETHPDLRLGQLLSNVTLRKLEDNLFFYEDHDLEDSLKKYIKENKIDNKFYHCYDEFLKDYFPKEYKEKKKKRKG